MSERIVSFLLALFVGTVITGFMILVWALVFGHDPWQLPTQMVWAVIVFDAYAYNRLKDRVRVNAEEARDMVRRMKVRGH